MTPDSHHDIFISYSRKDQRRLNLILRAMQRQNWAVWWDSEISPGARYDDEIERAIRNASIVLVLWSANAVKSNWVRSEADLAQELGTLIPARLDAASVPLAFRLYQTIDLSDWKVIAQHQGFDSLLSIIAQRIGKPVIDRKPEISAEQCTREGLAYAGRGEFDLAKEIYLRALDIDPEYKPALDALSQLTSPNQAEFNKLSVTSTLRGIHFGTLKWFNLQKGFGFISEVGSGEDVFVHVSSAERSNEKVENLIEGARVVFTTAKTLKGVVADNIRVTPW